MSAHKNNRPPSRQPSPHPTNNSHPAEAIAARVLPLIAHLGGDLSRRAESLRTVDASYEAASLRTAVAAHLMQWQEELSAASASPLERMLVDRLIADWMAVYVADQRTVADNLASPAEAGPTAEAQDRAHRRLLASARKLAAVQKMTAALPLKHAGNMQMLPEWVQSALKAFDEASCDQKQVE